MVVEIDQGELRLSANAFVSVLKNIKRTDLEEWKVRVTSLFIEFVNEYIPEMATCHHQREQEEAADSYEIKCLERHVGMEGPNWMVHIEDENSSVLDRREQIFRFLDEEKARRFIELVRTGEINPFTLASIHSIV